MFNQVKSLTIKTKLFISFAFLLLILNVFGIIFLINTAHVRSQFGLVIEEDEPAIANAHRLLRLVVDMETGQRGFCITNNEAFLEPYNKGKKEFYELLKVQKELVGDDPTQLKTLNIIHKLVDQWFEEAALPEIASRRKMSKGNESLKEVIDLLNAGTGKMLIDRVREESASFIKVEQELAQSRYAHASEMVDDTKKMVISLMALCSIFGAFVAAVTIRSISKPVRGLIKGTKIIGAGDLTHRIEIMQNNEIGELAKSFNEMVQNRQEAENELIQHRYHLEEEVKDRTSQLEQELIERKKAEEKLRDSENKSRAWLENSPVCTKIVDLDFNLQYMSRSGIEELKIKDITEFYGKPYPFYFYPESFKKTMTKNLEKVRETGEVIKQEARVVDVNGGELWYHSTLVPVKNDNGRIEYIIIVSLEITDLKKAEKAVQESEEQIRSIANYTYDWESWFAPDGNLMWVNPAVEKLTGYSVEECRQMSDYPLAIVHEDDREEFGINLQSAIFEHTSINDLEFRIRHKQGQVKWMAVSWQSIFDDHGNNIGLRTSVRDISERKLGEEALRESEERFRTLLKISPVGIYLTDTRGNCLFVNDRWCDITGLTFEDAVGQGWVKGIYPADRNMVFDSWLEFTEKLNEFELEYRFQRPKGTIAWVEGHAIKVLNTEGKPTEFLGTTTDITERKLSEEQLKEAKEKAESANQVKSQFLANMSHEIRTPMSVIIGFSDMLMTEELSNDQMAYAELIHNASNSLLNIINDILDFSKIEAGKLEIIKESCLLSKILDEIDSMMHPLADKKNLEFEINCSEKIPSLILTDEKRLNQCLINLLSNAIKFTHQGHVHLNVYPEELESEAFIRFDVEDTGIGVPLDKQGNIFESFTQIEKGSVRKYGGTGLGLSITNHLAELLGGKVSLTSEERKGSTFSLSIPVGLEMMSEPFMERKPVREVNEAIEKCKYSGKVLVAEDDQGCQVLEVRLFERMGLTVTSANDGKEAVETALIEPFDLIFMDVRMPHMDGFEAMNMLHEKGITTPIVALTAHAMEGYREVCVEAGYDDYLSKPIERKKLLEILDRYLPAATTA